MQHITIEELKARITRLQGERRQNQEQLAVHQEREHGFRYVLGELEQMIEELRQRPAVLPEVPARITDAEPMFAQPQEEPV